jgi:hypothetical protein
MRVTRDREYITAQEIINEQGNTPTERKTFPETNKCSGGLALATCPSLLWVIRVVSTVRRSLPVYPDNRTYSEPIGMSQRCYERKTQ